MDLCLQVIGGGPEALRFSAVDPELPVGDFIAFVLHQLRKHTAAKERAFQAGPANLRPRGPLPMSIALRYASSRISVLDAEGGLVCDLDGGLALGAKGAQGVSRSTLDASHASSHALNASMTDPSAGVTDANAVVGAAFRPIQTSPYAASALAKRGWLYLRDLPLTIHVVCKLSTSENSGGSSTVGGSASVRHSLASKGHCMFDIEEEGMLHMTIAEIKTIVSSKVRVPILDLWVTDPEDPAGELVGDTTMFHYLRTYGHITLKVVRREGIAVHVRVGAKTVTLPRLRSDTTLKEVAMRLASSFRISAAALYFDASRGFPEQYFRDVSAAPGGMSSSPLDALPDSTCLVSISTNGSDAYLSVSPLRPPAFTIGSDGRQNLFDSNVHNVHASPLPRVVSATAAIHAISVQGRLPQLTAKTLAHHTATAWGAPVERLVEPSEVPNGVTAQVTLRVAAGVPVSRALGPDPVVAEGEAFDVVLPPEDIRVFTCADLKAFIISNVLPQAQPSELTIMFGRKVIEPPQPLVYTLSPTELASATATLFLVCVFKPHWAH